MPATCGDEPLSYAEFRTGLNFYDVRQLLWVHSDNYRDWRHVTRRTVLGKWRELKLKMYAAYLDEFIPF